MLARVEQTTRFTEITLHVALALQDAARAGEKAHRLLEKAEKTCLVTNSLDVPITLDVKLIDPEQDATAPMDGGQN